MHPGSPRLLVLGDLHHAVDRAEALLTRLRDQYDTAVLLGDYFDNYGDTPAQARHTAEWLAGSLAHEDRVHLLGNHDLAYLFPRNPRLACPGFHPAKEAAVAEILARVPRERLRLAWAAGPWLFSHAGLHPSFAGGDSATVLAERANVLLPALAHGDFSPWLAIGRTRGGPDAVGGLTWLDWNQEFAPVAGLHQIVGHTPCRGVARGRHLRADGTMARSEVYAAGARLGPNPPAGELPFVSVNWCLDTGLDVVALIRGGQVWLGPGGA